MDQTVYGNVAQWVGAIATLLAVIVALFKEEIRGRFRRPSLEILIKLGPPDCQKTRVTYSVQHVAPTLAQTECYFLRFWVKNNGRLRAEKVEVFAGKLARRGADESFKQVDNFLPMNLRWTHSGKIFAAGLSPGMGRHCELGHITDPQFRAELGESLPGVLEDKAILALDLQVKPSTLSHLLAPGVYRLELKVAAANCAPVDKTVEINLTGDWYKDEGKMLSDGVGLKVVG